MARIPPPSRTPVWLTVLRYVVLAVAVALLLFGYQGVRIYTDWLWFGEMGRTSVYATTIMAGLRLFFGLGVLFFAIVYFNLWLARRLGATEDRPRIVNVEREQISALVRRSTGWLSLVGAIFLSVLVAGNAATHWSEYLLFVHSGSFGQADPVFGHDIGYYVFRLPFLSYLQSWLLVTIGAAAVGCVAVYLAESGAEMVAGSLPALKPVARGHILILAGIFAIVFAWGHLLARYDLLVSENGAYFGAGYTDIHARLPAANLQAALMLLTAMFCFVNVRVGRPFRLPIAGLALWAVGSALAVGVWPGFVQKFQVVPNQFDAEKEYIARDIALTRKAYGLDRVKEEVVQASTELSGKDLQESQATIDNVRLWDWPQLGAVYSVKQSLRRYYRFQLPRSATTTNGGEFNIDVDRYRFGDEYRQVMLAPREMDTTGLPPEAQTWQNERLVYTHGYGVVMSPVNDKDGEGLPNYFMYDIPVRTTKPGLDLKRPEIYYGEVASDYVIVGAKQNEFDYPAGDVNKETRYSGRGGVSLGGLLRKLAWSVRLGDTNLLLTGDVSADSRILFRRNIRDRVQKLAPFLNWDNDPYVVVHDGRLVWIMDGYTLTDRYPYSRPTTVGSPYDGVDQEFNYIRNSVKAVVDAYDGTVTMYIADPADPILRTWGRIFPGLFAPMAAMPADLHDHLRYPEDLFRVQRDIFTVYHINDPRVYYGKEDQWDVPQDPTAQTPEGGGAARMQPYYVIMRLPGDADEEFLMMSPYTPLKTPTLSAWLCAKCDAADYGQLVVYRFPKGAPVNGPSQVMAKIQSLPKVSQTQTLLGQQGSRVIFGNMLAIPIKSSLLFVVPLYVQASSSGAAIVPVIYQVIAANGDRVVMEPSLKEAMAALGMGAESNVASNGAQPANGGTQPGSTGSLRPAGTQAELLKRAADAYERARSQQKSYDSALEQLGAALKELQRQAAQGGARK